MKRVWFYPVMTLLVAILPLTGCASGARVVTPPLVQSVESSSVAAFRAELASRQLEMDRGKATGTVDSSANLPLWHLDIK